MKAIRLHNWGGPDHWEQPVHIGALIDAGRIRTIVGTLLPLAQARQTHKQGAKGQVRGELILREVN